MISESIERFARKKKLSLDFMSTNSADAIWIPTVCDKCNEDCVWQQCNKCGALKALYLLKAFLPYNDVKIEVPQWETVMVERKKNVQQENVEDMNLCEGKNHLLQLPMITLGRKIKTFNK